MKNMQWLFLFSMLGWSCSPSSKSFDYAVEISELLGLQKSELNIDSIEHSVGNSYIFEKTNDKSSKKCKEFRSGSYVFYQLYPSRENHLKRTSFIYKIVFDSMGKVVCLDKFDINTGI